MPDKLKLEVVVPDRQMFADYVSSVQVPAEDGYMGILPGHAPLMTQLGTGVLSYKLDGRTRYMALHGGVMEVLPDHVRVLGDAAEWAEEIDVKRAEEARRRANDMLARHDMEVNIDRASHAIQRAEARLEATKRHDSGRG